MIWFHCQLKQWRNNIQDWSWFFLKDFKNVQWQYIHVAVSSWLKSPQQCETTMNHRVLTSLSIWWSNISGHDSHIETVSILLNMLKFRKYPRNVFLTTPSDMEWRCVNNSDPWLKIFDGHAIKNLYSPSPANDKVSRELSWILVHKNCFCISSQLTILLHQLFY